MFRDILYHMSDNKAISKEDGFIHQPKIVPEKIKTIKVWCLLVEWIDGTNTWEQFDNLKKLYLM